MYRIISSTGEAFLTEFPTYVRVHETGALLITDRDRAEGVLISYEPQMFKDGAQCLEVDAAEEFMSIAKMAKAIREGVNDV